MNIFDPDCIKFTKYLFYTGKGGVGKTSVACATAVSLADSGKRVLLISTDPASNLQDVFSMQLTNKGTPIPDVPNMVVANLDPVQAAAEYRENVITPYRGKLPDTVLANMEEQLSGSCTVEIAAFSEFSKFITDEKMERKFDHIIFDTAPTGHTLRMLQLPSAWSNFIGENTHGASCLGQLSGLEDKKTLYGDAVDTLSNKTKTSFLDKVIRSLKECTAFYFSVSFIKKAGLVLLIDSIKNALERGAKGKLITSTYQNFTDIPSLEIFLNLMDKYDNFECYLDYQNFTDGGFHSKGYLFEFSDHFEIIVGSSNITRFALLKNIEWNIF